MHDLALLGAATIAAVGAVLAASASNSRQHRQSRRQNSTEHGAVLKELRHTTTALYRLELQGARTAAKLEHLDIRLSDLEHRKDRSA